MMFVSFVGSARNDFGIILGLFVSCFVRIIENGMESFR